MRAVAAIELPPRTMAKLQELQASDTLPPWP